MFIFFKYHTNPAQNYFVIFYQKSKTIWRNQSKKIK